MIGCLLLLDLFRWLAAHSHPCLLKCKDNYVNGMQYSMENMSSGWNLDVITPLHFLISHESNPAQVFVHMDSACRSIFAYDTCIIGKNYEACGMKAGRFMSKLTQQISKKCKSPPPQGARTINHSVSPSRSSATCATTARPAAQFQPYLSSLSSDPVLMSGDGEMNVAEKDQPVLSTTGPTVDRSILRSLSSTGGTIGTLPEGAICLFLSVCTSFVLNVLHLSDGATDNSFFDVIETTNLQQERLTHGGQSTTNRPMKIGPGILIPIEGEFVMISPGNPNGRVEDIYQLFELRPFSHDPRPVGQQPPNLVQNPSKKDMKLTWLQH
ncbi:unnamed protein product [Heligmosomoides polygyrus]|uniref:Peptidylprolyl isomerase n=1 Tax=Heligmosomoides polygyrus TaxID=6339 RepID=A0A3P8A9I7_HELPZ|nr:unnamed protein product [Heligmosomoides polygyrus]